MKRYPLKMILAASLVVATAAVASAAPARDTCSNSCVTLAIPRTSDGVITKLDGTADAVLWPPSNDLRRIEISAMNDRGTSCDVTIHDVRQDETPGISGAGTPIDDATNCSNGGEASSVELRSSRAANGDGRNYHVSFSLQDPDCGKAEKTDEVLVVVPRDENFAAQSLRPMDENEGQLTASYSSPTLQCTPAPDDRLAAADIR